MIYQLATRIFHLLESELTADFQTKFGLSWNLLKASIGKERGNNTQCSIAMEVCQAIYAHGTIYESKQVMKNENLVAEDKCLTFTCHLKPDTTFAGYLVRTSFPRSLIFERPWERG